jgi:hypothetical protein
MLERSGSQEAGQEGKRRTMIRQSTFERELREPPNQGIGSSELLEVKPASRIL